MKSVLKSTEKRIILKIGSSSLISKDGTINDKRFEEIIEVINEIVLSGNKIILVTSGAIAVGLNLLGLKKKPSKISLKQACAALGQARLIEEYQKHADKYGMLCSQILVNHDDFENRNRMMHLSNTLEELLNNNIIPIINENDALAVEEIKVGDNDTLSSLIVPMAKASLLILASDVDGLYDKNPNEFLDAKKIDVIYNINEEIENMASSKISNVGTGGMSTKIKAARIATKANCDVAIINSNKLYLINNLINGENVGTIFKKKDNILKSREHWIIFNSYAKGSIIVDNGAKEALYNNKSLLPSGIIKVEGEFNKSNVVFIKDSNNNIIGKGISNYSSDTVQIIKGKKNTEFKDIIVNYKDEVVHIDNLVFIYGDEYGNLR